MYDIHKRIDNLTEYLGVTILILFSKTVPFFIMMTPKVSILMMFSLSILFTFIYKKNFKNIFHNESLIYLLIFNISIIINITCFNDDTVDNLAISIIIWSIASYLIICRYNFNRFKYIYLRIIFIISFISISTFILYKLSIIHPIQTPRPEGGYYYLFLWQNFGALTHTDRLSSIFHEPGAYQIYLVFAIIFYAKELKYNLINKHEKIYLSVIVIAIIMTKSTAAYLITALLIFVIFKNSYIFRRYKLIAIVGSLSLFILIANSTVVKEKFDSESGSYESYDVRYNDNLAMLKMTFEKPIIGYGLGTKQWYKRSYELNNITGSNGILFMSSSLGILWLFIYIIFIVKAIKKMKLHIPTILILIIFLLLESNEAYVQVAISYLFIVQFAKERNIIINKKMTEINKTNES